MQLSSTKGAKVWPITKITFLYGFATSPIYWYRLSLTELSFSECVRVRPNIAVLEQIYSRDSPTETTHRRARTASVLMPLKSSSVTDRERTIDRHSRRNQTRMNKGEN
ncbi:hypothetical protein YC2023_088972 [Brassica napus]